MGPELSRRLSRSVLHTASVAVVFVLFGGNQVLLANNDDRPDVRTSKRVSEKHPVSGSAAQKETTGPDAEGKSEKVPEQTVRAEASDADGSRSEPDSTSETRLLGMDNEDPLRELSIP